MNRKSSLLILIFSFFALITFGQRTLVPLPKCKNGFIVIAHRGSHLIKPENSIAAIEEAIDLGADYVEIDLRTTRDGHLVLIHNETVDHTTNGKGRIQDLDVKEVKELTLNAKDRQVYRLPSFKDALKICKNRINIYLDFKEADVARAYEEIKSAGMEKQVLVYINKAEQYTSWRAVAPQMPLMSSISEHISVRKELTSFLDKTHLEATDSNPNPSLISTIREHGLSVFIDAQITDENPEAWNAIMDKGIQGIQTDHPEALIKFLRANNLRNGINVRRR